MQKDIWKEKNPKKETSRHNVNFKVVRKAKVFLNKHKHRESEKHAAQVFSFKKFYRIYVILSMPMLCNT